MIAVGSDVTDIVQYYTQYNFLHNQEFTHFVANSQVSQFARHLCVKTLPKNCGRVNILTNIMPRHELEKELKAV